MAVVFGKNCCVVFKWTPYNSPIRLQIRLSGNAAGKRQTKYFAQTPRCSTKHVLSLHFVLQFSPDIGDRAVQRSTKPVYSLHFVLQFFPDIGGRAVQRSTKQVCLQHFVPHFFPGIVFRTFSGGRLQLAISIIIRLEKAGGKVGRKLNYRRMQPVEKEQGYSSANRIIL